MGAIYDHVKKRRSLEAAWRSVLAAGKKSSKRTQAEVGEFELKASWHIDSLSGKLSCKSFKFAKQHGTPIPKPGKPGCRPIVVSPVADRVVQRAILDSLDDIPELQSIIQTPYSYGGVAGKGVESAISELMDAKAKGLVHFVRSDIKDYFTKIPKVKLFDCMSRFLDDHDMKLFEDAVRVDLKNAAELGAKLSSFPTHEVGVAQGCCLSPFVGNVILAEFDSVLNAIPDVKCLRYIDDFIIVSTNTESLITALDCSLKMLADLGLSAYDPRDPNEKAKAEIGRLDGSYDFLGCHFSPGRIQPGAKSVARFKDAITKIVDDSIKGFKNPNTVLKNHASLRDALTGMHNTSQGWSKHYGFCNCQPTFESIDKFIDEQISRLIGAYNVARSKAKDQKAQLRSLLGVYSVATKHGVPILESRPK